MEEIQNIYRLINQFDLTCLQNYRIYADYHWGNIKVIDRTKLGILDFGMVCRRNPTDLYFNCLKQLFAIQNKFLEFTLLLQHFGVPTHYHTVEWDLHRLLTLPFRTPGFTYTEEFIRQLRSFKHTTCNEKEVSDGSIARFRSLYLLFSLFQVMKVEVRSEFCTWYEQELITCITSIESRRSDVFFEQ